MGDKPKITTNFGGQPFQEQLDFFRQKVNLPTDKWDDLKEGMHARAFVIAGATRDDMLADFRTAVDTIMENGGGLKEFRAEFDNIVQKYGWEHNGEAGWRSKVIFQTNMRAAYMAGRYKQMTDPRVLQTRPFWQYLHGDSLVPRPEHLAWHGKVLMANDPWWQTHFPMNGWGCKCSVVSLSARDLKRDGLQVSESPTEPDDTTGIDEGFAYNVGEAAWGKPLSDKMMNEAKTTKNDWENITPGDPETYNLPEEIPLENPIVPKGPNVSSTSELIDNLKITLGGEEKTFVFQGEDFEYPIYVNAETLGKHLEKDLSRAPFLPFLEDTIENPTEAWLSFEKNKTTGRVALRLRFLKAHLTPEGKKKGLVFVATAEKGMLRDLTFVPIGRIKELAKERHGKLIKG